MPSFASTDRKRPGADIPIKNKRYQIPRYPLDRPMVPGETPIPGAGMLVPWTRTSTVLDTHKDKEGIMKWRQRLVAKGLGDREDLVALAAATRLGDKSGLDRVVEQAFDYAMGQSSANRGQALHGFLERWVEGDKSLVIPERYRDDVAAVMAELQRCRLTIRPEFQEVVVVRPDLHDGDSSGVAGRLDLMLENEHGQLVIADYKTGTDPLLYGALEIQNQTGFYGSGWAIWDGELWHPMPAALVRDHSVMIHVLPGQAYAHAERVEIDVEELEADLAAAFRTRRRRKEAKVQHAPYVQDEEVGTASMMNTVAQIEDEAHRAEVHPSVDRFRPTPSSPTPDAALQAHLAAERLAKVEAMAKDAGRNDDPDDEGPTFTGVSGQTVPVNGEGKPLRPHAGPGKKGCSVCGRIGHRKGSKACLGETDHPNYQATGTLVGQDSGAVPLTHPAGGHSWTRDPMSGDWFCAVGGEKAAEPIAAGMTREQERRADVLDEQARALISDAMDRKDDKSTTTGDEAILSGDEAEIRKWWSPNSDPDDTTTEDHLAAALRAGEMIRAGSYFPGKLTPAEVESVREASREAEEQEAAQNRLTTGADDGIGSAEDDPFGDDDEPLSAAEQDWHLFLDRINEAKDKAEIRAIRAEATELGVWDDALLKAGLERIKTF